MARHEDRNELSVMKMVFMMADTLTVMSKVLKVSSTIPTAVWLSRESRKLDASTQCVSEEKPQQVSVT
jgi:hypothetical protein